MESTGKGFFSFFGGSKQRGPDAASLIASGRSKVALGDHQGALADYERAISLDAKNFKAYALRGLSRAALGAYREAIQDYEKALELNPKVARNFYKERGEARAHLEDFEGAIDDFTKALELRNQPDVTPISNESLYFSRGTAKLKSGHSTSGWSDIRKAAELGLAEALEQMKSCPA